MAYIHLHQIGELAQEALSLKDLAMSHCYNADAKKNSLSDAQFVTLIKTYQQATNLFAKLKKLHRVCTDFIIGNFQPYVEEHDKWADDDTEPFDPFDVLERCFNSFSVDDLPVRIEQYAELLVLSRSFSDLQKKKREGLKQFFGDLPRYYSATDALGQTVLVPESNLSTDFLTTQKATEEIADIEIEYCLDGYNEFYTCATGLYSAYTDSNIVACAEAILSLFGPSRT